MIQNLDFPLNRKGSKLLLPIFGWFSAGDTCDNLPSDSAGFFLLCILMQN